MLAEIVTIGDELCRGEIVDTNATWLAAELWDLEVTVAWTTSCRDLAEDVRTAFRTAAGRAELILASGGLGPTEDDLTLDVVAELCGAEAVVHQPSLERMQARFARAGYRITANNTRQVRVPRGARVYDNPAGLAPAFEVGLGGIPVICMPGVPREMKAIFEASVGARVAELRDRRGPATERIARRMFRVFGRGESHVAAELEGLLAGAAAGVSIHYQAHFPETWVKVVCRDRDPEAACRRLDELGREIRARLGAAVYGVDADSLPAALGRALRAAGATLATAESCTGGLAGALVTAVPGSSDYYLGGAVCYADREKVRQLGVSEETLAARGAVSEEVALEMARGARERTGADLAVSITGIAGPGGGSADKPPGTVWIAVSGPEGESAKHYVWPGDREQVRTLAAYWALSRVLRHLQPRGEEGASNE